MRNAILITGAAKRIGAALAQHFASRGADLVLHYHQSEAAVQQLAATLRAEYPDQHVHVVCADLADSSALSDFWHGMPPVAHVIHNASRYRRDRLDAMTAADLRAHLAVNLESPLLLSQGFMAQLPVGTQGSITVIGDQAMRWSISPEFFSYAVSKLAWVSLIDLLAASVAPRARANLVALAPTLPGTQDPDGLFERLAERAPLQRTGTVAEVIAAVTYALENPAVTGQVLGLGNGMGLATWRDRTIV